MYSASEKFSWERLTSSLVLDLPSRGAFSKSIHNPLQSSSLCLWSVYVSCSIEVPIRHSDTADYRGLFQFT